MPTRQQIETAIRALTLQLKSHMPDWERIKLNGELVVKRQQLMDMTEKEKA